MNWLMIYWWILHTLFSCPLATVATHYEEITSGGLKGGFAVKGRCIRCNKVGFGRGFRRGLLRSYREPGEKMWAWHGEAFYNPSMVESLCLLIPFNFVYATWMKIRFRLQRGLRNEFIKASYDRGYDAGKRAGVIEGRSDSYMAAVAYNDLADLARRHFGG